MRLISLRSKPSINELATTSNMKSVDLSVLSHEFEFFASSAELLGSKHYNVKVLNFYLLETTVFEHLVWEEDEP